MQSRAEVVPLAPGDAVDFAVNMRPVRGARGDYRVSIRQASAASGPAVAYTLGIIFHDAA